MTEHTRAANSGLQVRRAYAALNAIRDDVGLKFPPLCAALGGVGVHRSNGVAGAINVLR